MLRKFISNFPHNQKRAFKISIVTVIYKLKITAVITNHNYKSKQNCDNEININ